MISLPDDYPAIGKSDFYPDGTPAVPGIRASDSIIINSRANGTDRVYLLTRGEKLFDPLNVAKTELLKQYRLTGETHWGAIILYQFESRPVF